MKKLFTPLFLLIISLCNAITINPFDDGVYKSQINNSDKKIYIDSSELETNERIFRIHLGGNVWQSVHTIHTDESGMFVYEKDTLESPQMYEKTWKCPYCNKFWPIGKPCQNPECPSKYKD